MSGPGDRRPFAPGENLPGPAFWDALADEVASLSVAAEPPLYARTTAGKTVLRHAPPLRMDARISAVSGTVYTCVEQRWDGSSWAVMPGGRTVSAYEYNRATDVPVNAVVELGYTAAGDWRFEHYRGTPCDTTVKVVLRRDDGTPLSNDPAGPGSYLETIGISYGAGPTLVAFDTTGPYHADGIYTSDPFPRDVAYTIAIRVVSEVNDSVSFDFAPSYLAGRGCDTSHEYDFCDGRFVITATDCVSGDPIEDLTASGTDAGTDHYALAIGASVLGATACSVAPPYAHETRYFGTVLGDPNLGNGHDGPGTYVEFWARLRERPYTCPAATWVWSTQKPPTWGCDQSGRYKPRCGSATILCGQVNSGDAAMYPLGSDWVQLGLDGGNCGESCEGGPYGAELRRDCSPSGLFPRVLTYTPAGEGPNDVQGELAGVPITLTCSGVNGSGELVYTADPEANLAGFYVCGHGPIGGPGGGYTEIEFLKWQSTTFTLRVGGSSSIFLDILNTNPQTCPAGKVHPTSPAIYGEAGEAATADASGVNRCHPVLIDFYATDLSTGTPTLTYIGTLTE